MSPSSTTNLTGFTAHLVCLRSHLHSCHPVQHHSEGLGGGLDCIDEEPLAIGHGIPTEKTRGRVITIDGHLEKGFCGASLECLSTTHVHRHHFAVEGNIEQFLTIPPP